MGTGKEEARGEAGQQKYMNPSLEALAMLAGPLLGIVLSVCFVLFSADICDGSLVARYSLHATLSKLGGPWDTS